MEFPGLGVAGPQIAGGLLGGTLGYNIQSGSWVWGIEGEAGWTSARGSVACSGPVAGSAAVPCSTRIAATRRTGLHCSRVGSDPRDHAIVGAALAAARERAGLTQQQLAKLLRKPQSFVSNYERGQRRIERARIAADR
jgi:hypothetical protein